MIKRLIALVIAMCMWWIGFNSRPYPAFGGEAILLLVAIGWVFYDMWNARR